MAQEPPYMMMSIRQICRVYKVGSRKVQQWIDEGAPIACLGGGKTGYRAVLSELQAWLVERTKKQRRAMCDQAMREVRNAD